MIKDAIAQEGKDYFFGTLIQNGRQPHLKDIIFSPATLEELQAEFDKRGIKGETFLFNCKAVRLLGGIQS